MGDYPQAHLHLHSSERQDVSEDDWSIILMAVVSLYWGCLRGEWRHVMIDHDVMLMWQQAQRCSDQFWPFKNFILKYNFKSFWFCTHINLNTLETSRPQQFGNSTLNILYKVNVLGCGLPLAEPLSPGNPVDFQKNRSLVGNWVTEPVICK